MFCPRSRRRTAAFVARSVARAACSFGALLAAPHAAADAADGAPVPTPPASASPVPAPGAPPFALSGFVRAVLAAHPDLDAARQGVRAALARVRQAGILADPSIELAAAPLSIGSAQAPFGFEASVSQTLPWFGKRALDRSTRGAEADAVERESRSLEIELGVAAVTLYGRWFVAARSLEINAAHVELVHALHAAALARVGSGRGSTLDALEAEAELIRLEHDSVGLAAERDVTLARMNELLHRAPEQPLPPAPNELERSGGARAAPGHREPGAARGRRAGTRRARRA